MTEPDFQTKFNRWVRNRYPGDHNGAFELKICKGKSLPFDAVQQHQVESLKLAKDLGLIYKIPDDSRGTKPFDSFKLKAPAFVVIYFYSRGVDWFYMIDVDIWITEVIESKRKSLTELRAAIIGQKCEFN